MLTVSGFDLQKLSGSPQAHQGIKQHVSTNTEERFVSVPQSPEVPRRKVKRAYSFCLGHAKSNSIETSTWFHTGFHTKWNKLISTERMFEFLNVASFVCAVIKCASVSCTLFLNLMMYEVGYDVNNQSIT